MKKILFLIALIPSLCFAQTAEKKWAIGLHLANFQYAGDYGSGFLKFDKEGTAGMISVARYITPSWDLEANGSNGMLTYSWTDVNPIIPNTFSGSLTNLEFLLKYKFNNGKILKEKSIIAPYLFIGVADGFYKNKNFFPNGTDITLNIPMGGGIMLNLSKAIAIDLRADYHYTFTEYYDGIQPAKSQYNDQFLVPSIGLIIKFDKKDTDKDGVSDRLDRCKDTPEKVAVDLLGCPKDLDKDGIPDYLDKCPEIKGVASANGCPDTDGDGITDGEDVCPAVAGLVSMKGCPDGDGDGVTDAQDKCPNVAGLTTMAGCPDADADGITDAEDQCATQKGTAAMNGCPDTDKDGVSDKTDKCPSIAGTVANNGCPEVSAEVTKVFEQALTGVQFESGKDIIKKTSFGILDNVVKIMVQNPDYKLDINGHTDNQGDDAKNLALSQNRANAVKKYISDKGVDASRMNATGFGETKAIDTNDTPAGRAKNRRVEFKLVF